MGSLIGNMFLLVFVLSVCVLMVAGTIYLIKRIIFEIKILDASFREDVKALVAQIIANRSRRW